jgi:hypothetical protein
VLSAQVDITSVLSTFADTYMGIYLAISRVNSQLFFSYIEEGWGA